MSPKSFLVTLLCVTWFSSYSQIPTTDKNWNSTTLVFNDNFNSFNTSNWQTGFGWGIYPPGDPCIYLPSQVTTSGGILTLKAESHTDPAYPLVNYKTGVITSIPTFKYGYFEIRCKLNSYGAKYMPAFWVWNADNCDCTGGTCSTGWYDEIDFFEVLDGDFSVTSNFHSKDGSCTEWDSYEDSFSDATLPTSFHVFGYEWTPNRVICYMDGVPYRTVVDSRIADHFLKLVIQLGMPAHAGPSVTLPGYMETDYVKVYGLNMSCSTDEVITNFNSGTYTNYSVKKSITVNGTSNVYSTDKVTLRAQNGIVLNGDFTVQSGAQFVILPTTCY